MKVSDLDNYQKKRLLESIEENLGHDRYTGLVEAVGEDGLLNMALEQAEKHDAEQAAQKEEKNRAIFWTISASIGLVGAMVAGIIGFKESGWTGCFASAGSWFLIVTLSAYIIIELISTYRWWTLIFVLLGLVFAKENPGLFIYMVVYSSFGSLLLSLWWVVKKLARPVGYAVAVIAAIPAAAIAGFALWKAGVYVTGGTAGWFSWLSDKF